VGDFNNDGIPDLVVTNTGDATVSVLLGKGDGTFGPAHDFLAGNLPSVVVTGDFDNDGNLDVAVANQSTGGVSVLLGNGEGTFQRPRHFALLPGSSLAALKLAVGHFHDPHILDLVAATISNSGLILLLGNGHGTFQTGRPLLDNSSVRDVAVADFNGDSKDDLVTINRSDPHFPGRTVVDVLLGNGDGTFAPPVGTDLGPFDLSEGVMVSDFNGDGIPDVLTINRSSNPQLGELFGTGDGTFQVGPTTRLAGLQPDSVAIADFNGDGIPDLAIAFPEDEVARQTTVSVLLGNGDGTYQAPLTFDVGSGPTSLAVGDFNSDGLPDLAVANLFSNGVSVLLNTGGESSAPISAGTAGLLRVLVSNQESARIEAPTHQPPASRLREPAPAETMPVLSASAPVHQATDAMFDSSYRAHTPARSAEWDAQALAVRAVLFPEL
jgi:hypothetical protein